MRPVPRSRHVLALVIFSAVAAGYGYLASVDTRLSPTQFHLGTAALKRHAPDLFPHDVIYGRSQMWQVQPPMFLAIMETVLVPTDYRDPTLPFRVLVFVVTLGYLCGMYSLLRRQCRSWSVSVFVAVLSSAVTDALGRATWGVGSLSSITPEGLCFAATPLVVVAFLTYAARWRVIIVFAVVGALGNIHLPTALSLTIILLVAYLVQRRFSAGGWGMAVACAICAALAAAPYVWYYAALRQSVARLDMAFCAGGGIQGLSLAASGLLYGAGRLMEDLAKLAMVVAAPVVLTAVVLSRVERFRVRDLGFWISWMAGVVGIVVICHGVALALAATDRAPYPSTDFLRVSAFIMLPLYALLAQAVTNLFRIFRTHRALVRWACAVVMLIWMLPSDNVRKLRHWALATATTFMAREDRPAAVQRHRERDERHRELVNIADWARAHTSREAMFLTDSIEFRMRARRSILVSRRDLPLFHRLTPHKLPDWYRCLYRQQELLHGAEERCDGPGLVALARDISRRCGFKEGVPWYVIVRRAAAPGTAAPMTDVQPKEGPARWGRYYKVYRLPVAGPTTQGDR